MWPKNASTTHIATFIGITLILSWTMAIGIHSSPELFGNLAGMLLVIPTMVAVTLNVMHHRDFTKVYQSVLSGTTKKSISFAIFYPLGFIAILALIAYVTGLARFNSENLPDYVDLFLAIISIAFAIIIAFGEEYGWRGFLLPALAKRFGKLKATVFVGLIWALYQMPAIYLIGTSLNSPNSMSMSLLQGAVVFGLSFPLAYCFFLTKGSIIPVLLFRAIWNTANSLILGDAAAQTPTLLIGNLNIISGQGILGLIVIAIAAVWFGKRLLKTPDPT